MNHRSLACTAAVAIAALAIATVPSWAQDDTLVGRRIVMKTGDAMVLHPVLTLPYAGSAPGLMEVEELGTGKVFPASLHDGVFTFVPEGGMPHSEHIYRVRNEADERPLRVRIQPHADTADGEALQVIVNDVVAALLHHGGERPGPRLELRGQAGTPPVMLWSMPGAIKIIDRDPAAEAEGGPEVVSVSQTSGEAYGAVRMEMRWEDAQNTPLLQEVREYRFYATPATARAVDVISTFTAAHGDAVIEAGANGGLVVAGVDASGTVELVSPDGALPAEEASPVRAGWAALRHDPETGAAHGVAVFDDPANPHHPARVARSAHGNLTLGPGAPLTIPTDETRTVRYRVVRFTGDTALDDRYRAFAQPPHVRWLAN